LSRSQLKLRCRRRSNLEAKQSGESQGIKKPQPVQDHPQVVAGAAQYRMNRIAQRTLERVAIALRRRIITRRPRVMPRRKLG